MPLITDCINSIIGKVDKIVCVDGSYKDWPIESDFSTDGTLEYLESIDKVELIKLAGVDEVAKRNTYLLPLNDGDTVLNLDSDEVLIGELPELKTDFGILKLHDGHGQQVQPRATRFFKYREGMRYNLVHYTLYYKGIQLNNLKKVLSPDFSFEVMEGCHLLHNYHMRPHLRQHYKSLYYKKLVKNEAGFPR
jgi:hypothetical protein